MTDNEASHTFRQIENTWAKEAIAEVERGLARDDPAFVRRFRNRCRLEMAAVIAVFLLLAHGVVLLTVGLATFSPACWIAGGAAFIASFGVHGLRELALRSSAHS